jgi:hypothetical protein
MEIGETCPECGWGPEELLEESLKNIGLIKERKLPGITDIERATKSAAYEGAGIAYSLVKLGLISSDEWMDWTKPPDTKNTPRPPNSVVSSR